MAAHRKYPKQTHEVGVYGIFNTINGKCYIGSSIQLSVRFGVHLRNLRRGRHHSQKLQRAFIKYGEAAFTFRVLVTCSKDDIDVVEQQMIDAYDAVHRGYNVAPCPRGGFMRGRTWPEDTKAARVEAMKGFKHTDASRARIKQGMDSRPEESKRLQHMRSGQARTGVPKSPEGAKNIASASLKRKHDPALALARSEATRKGHETRRKNRLANAEVA